MGKALGEQREDLCGGGEQAMQEKGMKSGKMLDQSLSEKNFILNKVGNHWRIWNKAMKQYNFCLYIDRIVQKKQKESRSKMNSSFQGFRWNLQQTEGFLALT